MANKKTSYCVQHDTYPSGNEPCWKCVQQYSEDLRTTLEDENKRLKKVAEDVADDLRYLTQKGRSGIPGWISNRASYCILAIEQALKETEDE